MDHSSGVGALEADACLETGMADFNPAAPFAADAFAQLAMELHDAPTVEETVDAVLEFALQAVSCSYAGIALAVRGQRAQVGAVTDSIVETIYQLQIDNGEGPLLTALSERSLLHIPDVSAETRWPEWRAKVETIGIGTVLHVPMRAAEQLVGVLSLYSTKPRAFDRDDEAVAHILARHAAIAVASARYERSMAEAIDARKLVGQAMGILMVKFDVDGDRAFAILKRYSQDTNTKLRDVAQHVIDTRKLPV
ncbi:GAF and ANTAR domain-containing protein [Kribbella deserti]|uniref:GAF and ANTAR domain-containing protein n=1 Tax=Kribbella deserti TaxID=1926257 RepID=A0ABV6QFJ2_9ACTN